MATLVNWISSCVSGVTGTGGVGAQEVSAQEQKVILETKQKLDPITILATCALLKFKEEGSRINYDRKLQVFIQQPSEYEILGISYHNRVRELFGQSCKDTCIIEIAIDKAAVWHQPNTENQKIYKTLFEHASEGIKSLANTYKKKTGDTELTVKGLDGWRAQITKVTSNGVAQEGELDQKAQEVKALWDRTDIEKVNTLIEQMKTKQGGTDINVEVKCLDEIQQLEHLLKQKHAKLLKIWDV